MSEISPHQSPEALPTGNPKIADLPPEKKKGRGCLISSAVVGCIVLVLGVSGFFIYRYYFHAHIQPVNLTSQEQQLLDEKLAQIEDAGAGANLPVTDQTLVELNQVRELEPIEEVDPEVQRQQEQRLRRTIVITDHEFNGMLNHNTDLGQTLKVEFKPGYIDIEVVIPVEDDVAVIGGKTIRTSVDISIEKQVDGSLGLAIRSVNVGGVPMPNAWLGGIKGQNLLEQFAQDDFFKKLAAGVEEFRIGSGEIAIVLAE